MADLERHNAQALSKRYETYKKERELAPVGYHKFGGEQDETIYEFVKTADGKYITRTTTKLPYSGSEYYTYNGEISFEGEGGVEESHFVNDVRMSPDTRLETYSGFSLDLQTGRSSSFLTDEKPEFFTKIEDYFGKTQAQAVVDSQNLAAANVQDE